MSKIPNVLKDRLINLTSLKSDEKSPVSWGYFPCFLNALILEVSFKPYTQLSDIEGRLTYGKQHIWGSCATSCNNTKNNNDDNYL